MTSPSKRFEGKGVLVVGAGQTAGATTGNGRAAAMAYAAEGGRVFLVDRDADSVRETAALVETAGGSACYHQADVASDVDCRTMVDAAVGQLGAIDVLHNNVGILSGDGSSTDLADRDWDRIMDVNLKGMWRTCKYVLPYMRASRQGSIVNISSIGSLMFVPDLLAYSLSKVGVNGLTKALALENAPFRIRVNCVLPGIVDTPLGVDHVARLRGATREEIAADRDAAVPLGRQGSGWDIAKAALFLASDDASFITGVLLPVDGGSTLRVGTIGAYASTPANDFLPADEGAGR